MYFLAYLQRKIYKSAVTAPGGASIDFSTFPAEFIPPVTQYASIMIWCSESFFASGPNTFQMGVMQIESDGTAHIVPNFRADGVANLFHNNGGGDSNGFLMQMVVYTV